MFKPRFPVAMWLKMICFCALIPGAATLLPQARAEEPVDLEMMTLIREEGFRQSHVMEIISELTDGIGPRLTGSPALRKANEWTRDKFTQWGLAASHLEAWGPFGRGWAMEAVSVRMVSPDTTQLYALPKAWTPGTNGPIRGKAIKVQIAGKEDFEKYRGKLAGMVVFNGNPPEINPRSEAFSRYDEKKTE